MEFISKPVICNRPGLTQEEALESLYERYGESIRVASVRQRGGLWSATILVPKTAEFPPGGGESDSDDSGSEGPPKDDAGDDSDSGSDSDSSDGGPPDGPPKGEGEHGKGGTEHQILSILHEIAQALGVGGGMPGDGMMPGGPGGDMGGPPGPGGPPGGGPDGSGALPPVRKPTKLRPGEVLPTQTPIGTPAFSSSNRIATGQCPHCGGPVGPDGTCPTCSGANAMGPGGGVSSPMPPNGAYSSTRKVASFVAIQTTNLSIKQANTELTALYGPRGYKVKQIVEGKDGSGQRELRALLSIR